jgi:hypothetical protein
MSFIGDWVARLTRPALKVQRLRSLADYDRHEVQDRASLAADMAKLESYVPKDGKASFTVPGFSYTAGKQVDFRCDFRHAGPHGRVNWRERAQCPITRFNNRMRATIHIIDLDGELDVNSDVYITEQVTRMYKHYAGVFPNLVGSEYLGDDFPVGATNENGVRHEDMTRLTFADNTFDAVISLDVLEHIPDYKRAFAEAWRVIKPGGRLIWSVPFIEQRHETVSRAVVEDGKIRHILPPEIHGNPVAKDEGSLCFQHFGWQMLDEMREVGFADAYSACVRSMHFGYFGPNQHIFFAEK